MHMVLMAMVEMLTTARWDTLFWTCLGDDIGGVFRWVGGAMAFKKAAAHVHLRHLVIDMSVKREA